MSNSSERVQILLDQAASGQLSRRRFLTAVSTAGLAAGFSGAAVEHALAAGENQAFNQAQLKGAYDYIVVGGGASGSIIAGELSKTGAKVLLVESGGADNGPTWRPTPSGAPSGRCPDCAAWYRLHHRAGG
jgi:choline dehydrogenase